MKRYWFFPAFFLLLCAVPALSDPGVAPLAREIAIRECVETALRGNVDIAVSRSEQEEASQGDPLEEAAFLPRFTGDLSSLRSVGLTGSSIAGTLPLDQNPWKFDPGVRDFHPLRRPTKVFAASLHPIEALRFE